MTKIQPQPVWQGADLWTFQADWLTTQQVKARLRSSDEAKGRQPVMQGGVWYWEASWNS